MTTTNADNLLKEVERRYRVADQMVTMHSILRDIYGRRAVGLDSMIFLSSIIIAALAFVDPTLLEWVPWDTGSTRIAIGILAIVAFFASIMAWRVDWKGKADAHARAASAYTKAKFNLAAIDGTSDIRNLELALAQYEEIGRNAIPIPDSKFLNLKSEHLLKIEVSRFLDHFPGVPVRCVKLQLRIRDTFRSIKNN